MKARKRINRFLLVSTVVVLVLGVVGVVSAQAPTAYYVGFSMRNLSTTDDAAVLISYYNQDGTGASTDPTNYTQSITIPASNSKTVICSLTSDLSSDILAPAPAIRGASSFVGSVIISSDQEIVAIANEAASVNNPYGSASYDGISQSDLSSTVYAPLIAQLGQPNTTINIQNPNNSAVDVVVEYTAGVYGQDYTAPSASLPAYGSAIWEVPSGAFDGNGRFLGSAKLTATGGDVAVIVDAIYATSAPSSIRYNARQSYNAFPSGSSSAVAPLIQKNDYGVWYVGLQIMNVGPGSATVRVTYNGLQGTGTDASCVPSTPVSGLTEPDFTLDENEQSTILTEFGGALDSTALAGVDCFRGAAIVEVVSGTGQVVANVSVAGQNLAQLALYRAFDPAAATDTLTAPLVQKYLGVSGANGWSTGINVANLGGTTATVTGTFDVTCGGVSETIQDSVAIDPNSQETFLQLNGWGVGDLGTRVNCLGSATFSSDAGQPIVALVQQSFFGKGNPFTGDVLLAYEAFNQ